MRACWLVALSLTALSPERPQLSAHATPGSPVDRLSTRHDQTFLSMNHSACAEAQGAGFQEASPSKQGWDGTGPSPRRKGARGGGRPPEGLADHLGQPTGILATERSFQRESLVPGLVLHPGHTHPVLQKWGRAPLLSVPVQLLFPANLLWFFTWSSYTLSLQFY